MLSELPGLPTGQSRVGRAGRMHRSTDTEWFICNDYAGSNERNVVVPRARKVYSENDVNFVVGDLDIMAARTTRMTQIEAMLANEPHDPELRYFLAMEFLSAGDEHAAADCLRELTGDSTYVPAFLQAGQVLNRLGLIDEACAILRRGIAEAGQQGNTHALGEMQGLLDSIE